MKQEGRCGGVTPGVLIKQKRVQAENWMPEAGHRDGSLLETRNRPCVVCVSPGDYKMVTDTPISTSWNNSSTWWLCMRIQPFDTA